jgi:hypothetical protein
MFLYIFKCCKKGNLFGSVLILSLLSTASDVTESCFGTENAQMNLKNDVYGVFSVFMHGVEPFSGAR